MTVLSIGKRSLRKVGLFALSRINAGDISIRHHYTNDRIRLHSFRHRGYWFHGRRRERAEMAMFARLIRRGDCVIEVGGHIGYISLYFASLVGADGSVHVFEPGSNNLPYTRHNLAAQPRVRLVEKGVGDRPGVVPMHLENLTGQNNSLVADFAGLAVNQRNAVRATVVQELVDVTTLDHYATDAGVAPDFIKIDVEGFEWEVLQGARAVLERHRPTVMVEVQTHHADITELFHALGYALYGAGGQPIDRVSGGTVNVFCVPRGHDLPNPRPGGDE